MKRSRLAAFAGLVIAVVVLVVAMVSGQQAPTAPGESPGTAVSTTSAPPAAGRGPENPSGLPAVNASQLPKEARQTLVLIAKGGPYHTGKMTETSVTSKDSCPRREAASIRSTRCRRRASPTAENGA